MFLTSACAAGTRVLSSRGGASSLSSSLASSSLSSSLLPSSSSLLSSTRVLLSSSSPTFSSRAPPAMPAAAVLSLSPPPSSSSSSSSSSTTMLLPRRALSTTVTGDASTSTGGDAAPAATRSVNASFEKQHYTLELELPGAVGRRAFAFSGTRTVGDLVVGVLGELERAGVRSYTLQVRNADTHARLPHSTRFTDLMLAPFELVLDDGAGGFAPMVVRVTPPADVYSAPIVGKVANTGARELRDVLFLPVAAQLRSWLETDERPVVPLAEFAARARAMALGDNEAMALLHAFNAVGIVLFWPHNPHLREHIVLRPLTASRRVYERLGVDMNRLSNAALRARLDELQREFTTLDAVHTQLRAAADRHAGKLLWLGLAYVTVQFSVMARFTWYEYNWDIMEPVTYFCTFGAVIIGYAFYTKHKQEYTYENTRSILANKKFAKLCAEKSFDLERWHELRDEIDSVRTKINDAFGAHHVPDVDGRV